MAPCATPVEDAARRFRRWPAAILDRRGDGSVMITELSATPVPEPASLALLGAGFAGLLTVRRRRAG